MNQSATALSAIAALAALTAPASAVLINGFEFDLNHYAGASVTYRADGSVTFDGKAWDQAAGVDGFTLGELAAGQFGGDPGDQISLNATSSPDWLQLNYGTPIALSAAINQLVIYEISSAQVVDPEGLSFRIKINGGAFINATAATATNFNAGIGSDGPAEDANQLVFDLFALGFNPGDMISTVYIENINSGPGTSDPDFIFMGLAVPTPAAASVLAMGALSMSRRRRA